jgi:uncharacterized protein YdiU (UPF0061 family)
MMVGFIHGVMNTDNMSICGETIDYGPCAFMDQYHPDTVFSSIDHHGRYAYGNQPVIAQWNLARFSETLLPLLSEDRGAALTIAKEAIDRFPASFLGYWLQGMRSKLGLETENPGDLDLSNRLLSLMLKHEADYTYTFRTLSNGGSTDSPLFTDAEFIKWKQDWNQRLAEEGSTLESAQVRMLSLNPAVIPRNHLVEEALLAANESGNLSALEKLLEALKNPYAETEVNVRYREPPTRTDPDYRTFCGT